MAAPAPEAGLGMPQGARLSRPTTAPLQASPRVIRPSSSLGYDETAPHGRAARIVRPSSAMPTEGRAGRTASRMLRATPFAVRHRETESDSARVTHSPEGACFGDNERAPVALGNSNRNHDSLCEASFPSCTARPSTARAFDTSSNTSITSRPSTARSFISGGRVTTTRPSRLMPAAGGCPRDCASVQPGQPSHLLSSATPCVHGTRTDVWSHPGCSVSAPTPKHRTSWQQKWEEETAQRAIERASARAKQLQLHEKRTASLADELSALKIKAKEKEAQLNELQHEWEEMQEGANAEEAQLKRLQSRLSEAEERLLAEERLGLTFEHVELRLREELPVREAALEHLHGKVASHAGEMCVVGEAEELATHVNESAQQVLAKMQEALAERKAKHAARIQEARDYLGKKVVGEPREKLARAVAAVLDRAREARLAEQARQGEIEAGNVETGAQDAAPSSSAARNETPVTQHQKHQHAHVDHTVAVLNLNRMQAFASIKLAEHRASRATAAVTRLQRAFPKLTASEFLQKSSEQSRWHTELVDAANEHLMRIQKLEAEVVMARFELHDVRDMQISGVRLFEQKLGLTEARLARARDRAAEAYARMATAETHAASGIGIVEGAVQKLTHSSFFAAATAIQRADADKQITALRLIESEQRDFEDSKQPELHAAHAQQLCLVLGAAAQLLFKLMRWDRRQQLEEQPISAPHLTEEAALALNLRLSADELARVTAREQQRQREENGDGDEPLSPHSSAIDREDRVDGLRIEMQHIPPEPRANKFVLKPSKADIRTIKASAVAEEGKAKAKKNKEKAEKQPGVERAQVESRRRNDAVRTTARPNDEHGKRLMASGASKHTLDSGRLRMGSANLRRGSAQGRRPVPVAGTVARTYGGLANTSPRQAPY